MQQTSPSAQLNLRDTTKAFAHLSDSELRFHYWIFRLMNSPTLTGISTSLAEWAIRWHLPVSWAAKPTIFQVFCGGETIEESLRAVEKLGRSHVGAILDYSVEGQDDEKGFDRTEKEILRIINIAAGNKNIPVSCIKISGIASNSLLEKMSAGKNLSPAEQQQAEALRQRFARICKQCEQRDVPIYVDAEESWIQPAIDKLVENMMFEFNKKRSIVFQTIQMFRHDRLNYYKQLIAHARGDGFRIGMKIVRGAYLDKENQRARDMGYPTPIQADKAGTDRDYNAALALSIENIDIVEICAGTHNEESALYLAQLMAEKNLPNNHPSIWFSQLYGMSDYMSYNLSAAGYNVSKYLPYGPVRSTLPYLIRRAKENTAIAGQMSKELQLLEAEMKRRSGR